MAAMRVPVWLKILWTVWVVVWAPLYWKHYGAQNLLYFCDLGNFFISAALWLESPLLFSSQASGLLLFQSLYTIDLLGAALSVSPGYAASVAVGDLAVGIRSARMEVSDSHRLGGGAHQLFLAAGA